MEGRGRDPYSRRKENATLFDFIPQARGRGRGAPSRGRGRGRGTESTNGQFAEEKKKNEICYQWRTSGTCSWGAECKFLHSDPLQSSSPSSLGTANGRGKRMEPAEVRERGKVFQVDEGRGGFIAPDHATKKITYRSSDVEDKVVLREGDTVEYTMVQDPKSKRPGEEFKAIKIKLLGGFVMHGDKQREDDKEKKASGSVSLMPAWMKSFSSSSTTSMASAASLSMPSSTKPRDVSSRDGDGATREFPTKKTRAADERKRLEAQGYQKVRGIVDNVKETFGFIRCNAYPDPVFYHINEVEDGKQFEEGDEVEFFLLPDQMKDGQEMKATCVSLAEQNTIFRTQLSQPTQTTEEKPNFADRKYVLEWIKKMSDKDGEMLLLYLNQLEELLNQDELSFTITQPLLSLLTSASIRNSDRTDKVFKVVLKSKFLRHPRNLRAYIMKLSEQIGSREKRGFIASDFEAVVNLLEQIDERCQPLNYTDLPLDVLNGCAVKIKDSLNPTVIEKVDRMLKNREQQRTVAAQQFNASEWTPQGEEEDFRDISVFPSTEEILSIGPGELAKKLSPNIVEGKYKNVMHYLDTHFRLLREDCLQPLREGIKGYIAHKQARSSEDQGIPRDIRVYHHVRLKGLHCSRNGIVYRVSFKLDCEVAWERSKRLIYGSLICLSCDDFKTILYATVENRDVALLSTNKEIDIRFPKGYEREFRHGIDYTMVESSTTYFEAYQHVLKALQQLDILQFPFVDYLISCKPNVEPPSYLKPKVDTYTFVDVLEGKTSFSVLSEWPRNEIETTMDDSQLNALKHSITKELAIVQGPPGTGKTFVGLKVMRCLLNNRSYRRDSPILVICYTNHALDQFLEGVLQFEEKIVRIGGRSKSDILKEKNIRKLMYESGHTGKQHHRSRNDINAQLDQLTDQIETCISDLNKEVKELLKYEEVESVATPEQLKSLLSQDGNSKRKVKKGEFRDILKFWLNSHAPSESEPGDKSTTTKKLQKKTQRMKREELRQASQPKKSENGVKREEPKDKPVVTSEREPDVDENEEEVDDEVIQEIERDRMVGEDDTQAPQQNVFELSENIVMDESDTVLLADHILNATDVWQLTWKEKRSLYRHWVIQVHKKSRDEGKSLLPELCQRYEELCREKRLLEEELQIEVLSKSRVIGMTTTGVAKFQRLIHHVQPEVIIVEEAAEVLEAHIIAALSPSTKHLVLIGDHEQLRPSTAVYRLSTQFNLDVSLFERLVRNGVEQVTLRRQRRMRPEISSLIHPIYPPLEDHPYVKTYPQVMGVSKNLFFLHHTFPETANQDISSKSNEHEATFIGKLCNYLLLQGYKPEQITVLTAYSGQVYLLRKEFRKNNLPASVRITSVDNFQGEENDIILLSLVRSNKEGIIGFLNASNRICVALSRARIGLFIIGNAQLLTKKHQLWRKVIDTFKNLNAFGSELVLQCQNHPAKFTKVVSEHDFARVVDGGCDKYCGQMLNCGHTCPRFCHPFSHDQLQCHKPCLRKHEPCNHTCNKRCFEPCGDCEVIVEKKIEECGHVEKMPCHIAPEEFVCTHPCEKFMKCKEHKCPRSCGEQCPNFCHQLVNRDLKCGHVIRVECGETKFKCHFPCGAALPCGHTCTGDCTACQNGKEHVKCTECD